MTTSVYVDGAGGAKSGFGFFIKETGESFYEERNGLTNNQAEYLAIIAALKKFQNSSEQIVIFSDSKNTVNQLNHEFAINNEQLRTLAQIFDLKTYNDRICFPFTKINCNCRSF